MALAGENTIGPAECEDFGHVSVYQGESAMGAVYQCKGISDFFGGGLYDTWLGQYLEDLDTQDIDRIFRQEEAQEFKAILDGLEDGSKTWRDLAAFELDFLLDIPEMGPYYDALLERVTYDGLLQDIGNVQTADDWQRIFDEYSAAGMGNNSYTPAGALGFFNPPTADDLLKEMCKSSGAPACAGIRICPPGQTTTPEGQPCVDPTGVQDIWDDLLGNIFVIFKSIGIDIPDWFPTVGVFAIPTIKEIFDGTFGDIDFDQCMEEGTCIEEVMGAIGNATEEAITKAGEKVQEVLGGIVGAVQDPKQAAEEIYDWIKGVFGEDPTAFPPWVWGVIIAGEYGDEILSEIEKVTGQDVDGDGTIGFTPQPEFDCRTIGKQGGIVKDASECGDCLNFNEKDYGNGCEPKCQYNDAYPASDTENCVDPNTFDCSSVGKSGGMVQSEADCGECLDTAQKDFGNGCEPFCEWDETISATDEQCEEPLTETEIQCNAQGKVYDSLNDECKEECKNPDYVIGADGNCGPAPIEECTDPNRDKNPDGSCADTCSDGSPAPASGLCPEPVEQCTDPNREKNADGSCGDTCTDGSPAPASGLCPQPEACSEVDCNGPRPDAAMSFDAQRLYRLWNECCGGTNCPKDGSLISDHPNNDCNIEIGTEACQDPKATNTGEYGPCQCPDGFTVSDDGKSCIADGVDCSEITDANYQECGKEKCQDGTFADVGQCPTGPDCSEITDANYQECGKEKCEDGTFADVGQCPTEPQECAKPDGTPTGATLESGCEQCPDGYTFDFNGICQPDAGTINCEDYNRTTNDDGTCGPCKEGYEVATGLPDEPCVPIFDGCPAGYVLDQDLGECVPVTCPDGQAFCDDTGQCEDIGTCPSDPPTTEATNTFGGGGSAGGGGMMTGRPTGYMGDPQLLSRTEFPITDFLAGLFSNLRGE